MENETYEEIKEDYENWSGLINARARKMTNGPSFSGLVNAAIKSGRVTDNLGNPIKKYEDFSRLIQSACFHYTLRGQKVVYRFSVSSMKEKDQFNLAFANIPISEEEFREAIPQGGVKPLVNMDSDKFHILDMIGQIGLLDDLECSGKTSEQRRHFYSDNCFGITTRKAGKYALATIAFDTLIGKGLLFYQDKNGEWKQPKNLNDLDLENRPRMYALDEPGGKPYTFDFDKEKNFIPSISSVSKDRFAEFLLNEKPPVQKRPWGGAQFLRYIANGIRKLFRAEELPEYREHKEAMQAFQEKKNAALKKAGYQVEEAPQEEKPASKGVDYQKQAEEICQKVRDTLDLPAEDEKAKAFLETMKNAMSEKGNVAWGIRHFVQDTVKDAGGKQLLEKLYQDFDPKQADATKEILTGFVAPKLGDAETAGEYRAYMSSELQSKQKQLWSDMDKRMVSDSKEKPLVSEEEFDTEIKKDGFSMNK